MCLDYCIAECRETLNLRMIYMPSRSDRNKWLCLIKDEKPHESCTRPHLQVDLDLVVG